MPEGPHAARLPPATPAPPGGAEIGGADPAGAGAGGAPAANTSAPPRPRRWTFSQRLALVYGAVSLVVLLGAGAFTAWQASLITRRNEELAVAETRRMAERVGAALAQARQGVSVLATADPMARGPVPCETLLNAAHLTMDALIRHLFVTDQDGRIACTTLPSILGRPANSPVIRSAELTGRPVTGALGESVLGRVITVAHPMRRGGRHAGVVAAAVGVEELRAVTTSQLPEIESLRVWLLDSAGASATLVGPAQPLPPLPAALHQALATPDSTGTGAVQANDQVLIQARATDDLSLVAAIPGHVLQAGAPLEIALPPLLLALVLLAGMGALFWSVQRFVVAPLEAATRRLEAPDGALPAPGEDAAEGAEEGSSDVADLIRRVGAARASRDEAIRLRDMLLREAHHRIKNHLTLVTSFLRLQERQLSDHAALQALRAAQGRMVAIGMTYELLHDGAGQFVALDQMLHRFTRALAARDMAAPDRADGNAARIEADLTPIEVPADIAVKIGLVVNELATNSLKYAFAGRPPGTVRITLRPVAPPPGAPDQPGFTLRISDDGAGMREGGRRGLGMTVVDSLLRGIDARMERLPGPGTTFLITWLPRPPPRHAA